MMTGLACHIHDGQHYAHESPHARIQHIAMTFLVTYSMLAFFTGRHYALTKTARALARVIVYTRFLRHYRAIAIGSQTGPHPRFTRY